MTGKALAMPLPDYTSVLGELRAISQRLDALQARLAKLEALVEKMAVSMGISPHD